MTEKMTEKMNKGPKIQKTGRPKNLNSTVLYLMSNSHIFFNFLDKTLGIKLLTAVQTQKSI